MKTIGHIKTYPFLEKEHLYEFLTSPYERADLTDLDVGD